MITKQTMEHLKLTNPHPTSRVLELADQSNIKPKCVLDDVIISLDSWEYPIDFIVLQIKYSFRGHPLILGRPCLATTDAFNGCRFGNMVISHGDLVRNVTL